MNFLLTTVSRYSLAVLVVLASGTGVPAIAQSEVLLEAAEEVPTETIRLPEALDESIVEADKADADIISYADEKISVDYPAAWKLERLDDGIMISSVAETPAELVATQIVRMAAPPGAVVNANIESFTEEGSAVARYSRATIDGQDALMMWLSDRPDELGSAIATFIGYDNETVLLFSRYAPENTTAEEAILQLHASFTDPMAPTDTATEALSPADSTDAETGTGIVSPEEAETEVIVPANESPVE